MQLLRLADVRPAQQERVFRYSPAKAAAAAVTIVLTSAALVAAAWSTRFILLYYVAAVLILGLVVLQTFVRARFQPSNWLVRTADNGIFVQFRSYLNARFPAAHETVAFISYGEIRSARLVRQRLLIPDRDSSADGIDAVTEERRIVVDLQLQGDVARLARAIDDEIDRALGPARADSASTRYRHVPVRMSSGSTLQIEWKVTPGADVFVELLRSRGIATAAGEETLDTRVVEVPGRGGLRMR